MCCGLGHAAPPTPPAVIVTQKRIPADFLFGRALLIETSVHLINRWILRVLGSQLSPSYPTAEPSINTGICQWKTLIWRLRASFGIKLLAVQSLCSIFPSELWIWLNWSDFTILKRCIGWCPVCWLCCRPSWVQLRSAASACPGPPTVLSGSLLLTQGGGCHPGLMLPPEHPLRLQVNHS